MTTFLLAASSGSEVSYNGAARIIEKVLKSDLGTPWNGKVLHGYAALASLSVNEGQFWNVHSAQQACSGHGL